MILQARSAMKTILKIAVRNLLRNKRRTAILIVAMTIGLGAIVFLRGFASGAQGQMIDNIVSIITSEITIVPKEMENIYNTNGMIGNVEEIRILLRNDPRIQGHAEEVFGTGIVASPYGSMMTFVSGIDLEEEEAIGTRLPLASGRLFGPESWNEVLIGEKMRRILDVQLGEKVVVTVQDLQGTLTGEAFRLVGTLEIGNDQLDSGTVVLPFETVRRLLGTGDRISKFAIKVKDRSEIPAVVRDLRRHLQGTDLSAMTWDELIPMLAQMIRFQNGMIFVVLLIVLSVVSAGILNTLLMSVIERVREFGLMLALGTRPCEITLILVTETFLLSLTGSLCGLLVGISTVLYLGVVGIDLSRFLDTFSNFLVGSHVYPRVDWAPIGIFTAVVLFANLLAAVYPAWKAAHLQPVEAMREVG